MGKMEIPIYAAKPGMILANDILSAQGKVLLSRGLQLNIEQIDNLRRWDIHAINVLYDTCGNERDYWGYRSEIKGKREFAKFYRDTLQMVKQAFETTCLAKNVPLEVIDELVAERIGPLIGAHGAVKFLFNIHAHCKYTYRHSINVAILSGIIGKSLGLQEDRLRNLVMAGLLHDLGKLSIAKDILHKPGKLTEQEMAVIKEHPCSGHRLILHEQFCDEVKFGVLQHHERIDGSGYPQGLVGEQIGLYAKVIAVADIYDAMTSDRVYRPKLTPFYVVETIAEQMYKKQLDPEVCLNFLQDVKANLSNSNVLLSNGQKGEVVYLNNTYFEKPLVILPDGTVLDLGENKEIEIVEVGK